MARPHTLFTGQWVDFRSRKWRDVPLNGDSTAWRSLATLGTLTLTV